MIPVHYGHPQQAIKMNGVFVQITTSDFQNLLNKNENLMVVVSKTGLFTTQYLHLTSYKGLVFYCKAKEPLSISYRHEVIQASSVFLPTQF